MKQKTKIILERHYSGTESENDVFKKVLLSEVARKLDTKKMTPDNSGKDGEKITSNSQVAS